MNSYLSAFIYNIATKVLKLTFLENITFRKNTGCYSLAPHKNLVPEIKGFLGFRKGEGY